MVRSSSMVAMLGLLLALASACGDEYVCPSGSEQRDGRCRLDAPDAASRDTLEWPTRDVRRYPGDLATFEASPIDAAADDSVGDTAPQQPDASATSDDAVTATDAVSGAGTGDGSPDLAE